MHALQHNALCHPSRLLQCSCSCTNASHDSISETKCLNSNSVLCFAFQLSAFNINSNKSSGQPLQVMSLHSVSTDKMYAVASVAGHLPTLGTTDAGRGIFPNYAIEIGGNILELDMDDYPYTGPFSTKILETLPFFGPSVQD